MVVLAWCLRALLGLVVLGWLLALLKVWGRRRNPRWNLGPSDAPLSPDVKVSVVIPARNEEANIGACLDAVLAQDHDDIEIIVMNDGSTDGTGAVLARYEGVTVLEGDGGPLPEGWFGKPWALQRAQEHATGQWLFFIDADVRLAPPAVSRVVQHGVANGRGMVTGLGTLTMDTFWEKVLQPAVAGLILMGNDLNDVNDPDKTDKNMASGQLLAFSRAGYDQAGQHESVKNDILDDVGLARACVAHDVPYHCLFMRELYTVRMYTTFQEIWEGWSKNLFAGMHYSWVVVFFVLIYLGLTTLSGPLLIVLSLTGVIGGEWLVWGLVHVGVMQFVRGWMDRIWGQELLYGLSHAPATAVVMAIIVNSGLKSRSSGVSWKGRSYVLGEGPDKE
ncbi:MAG: glycosyltransferase [Proteobacteria bacterium]|nr:glycosyltransferase [Pseudomonadota bacterium]